MRQATPKGTYGGRWSAVFFFRECFEVNKDDKPMISHSFPKLERRNSMIKWLVDF